MVIKGKNFLDKKGDEAYYFDMNPERFLTNHLVKIKDAAYIAEEVTHNHFKLSHRDWIKMPFEVKTLAQLQHEEITDAGYAQLVKYQAAPFQGASAIWARDYYHICLQDPKILEITEKRKMIPLFPFLIYIITHELVHMVRFHRFMERFGAHGPDRQKEEERVNHTTREILRNIPVMDIKEAIEYNSYALP